VKRQMELWFPICPFLLQATTRKRNGNENR